MPPRQSKGKTSDKSSSRQSYDGGLWVPRYVGLNDHHKVKKLVELTNDERISWHLEQLWASFAIYRPEGSLVFRATSNTGPLWATLRLEPEKPIVGAARIIAEWSRMKAIEPMQWLSTLVAVRWLDVDGDEQQGTISPHKWERYFGKYVEKRAADADRKRRKRKERERLKLAQQGHIGKGQQHQGIAASNSAQTSGGRPADVRGNPALEEMRSDERRGDQITTTPDPLRNSAGGAALELAGREVVVAEEPHLKLVPPPPPPDEEARLLWEGALAWMKQERKSYAITWLSAPSKIRPLAARGEVLVLGVADRFFRDWVDDHYRGLMEHALTQHAGVPMTVEYEVVPELAEQPEPEPPPEPPMTEDFWWEQKELLRARRGLPPEKERPSWFRGWFREREKEGNAAGSLVAYSTWLRADDRTRFGWVDLHWPLDHFRSRKVWESRLPKLQAAV